MTKKTMDEDSSTEDSIKASVAAVQLLRSAHAHFNH